MTLPLYSVFVGLSLILLVVDFATGAFFSKTVGIPLGLGVVLLAILGIFFAAVAGAVLFGIAGIIFLIIGVLVTLAALGGE